MLAAVRWPFWMQLRCANIALLTPQVSDSSCQSVMLLEPASWYQTPIGIIRGLRAPLACVHVWQRDAVSAIWSHAQCDAGAAGAGASGPSVIHPSKGRSLQDILNRLTADSAEPPAPDTEPQQDGLRNGTPEAAEGDADAAGTPAKSGRGMQAKNVGKSTSKVYVQLVSDESDEGGEEFGSQATAVRRCSPLLVSACATAHVSAAVAGCPAAMVCAVSQMRCRCRCPCYIAASVLLGLPLPRLPGCPCCAAAAAATRCAGGPPGVGNVVAKYRRRIQ